MIKINSKENNIVKQINQLKIRKYREKLNLFILEGERAISQAFDNKCKCEYIAYSEKYVSKKQIEKREIKEYIISDKIFDNLCDTENNQGVIGVFEIPKYSLENIIKKEKRIILLDRLQDPGNIGTIIRTAEAAGYGAVLMTKGTADAYSGKVSRSTVGANTSIPIVNINEEELKKFKDYGYKFIVTALNENSSLYNKINYGKKSVIVVGNEANGVSDKMLEIADITAIIPIYGRIESLNVSVASAIMIYESIREE